LSARLHDLSPTAIKDSSEVAQLPEIPVLNISVNNAPHHETSPAISDPASEEDLVPLDLSISGNANERIRDSRLTLGFYYFPLYSPHVS
jgi:hypothetical protein